MKVLAEMESGRGNALEAALVLHLAAPDQDSLSRLIITFGSSEVWILNKTSERLFDPAVTEGSDGKPYVAAFTSLQRAGSAVAAWKLSNRPSAMGALELIFGLSPMAGVVLNADDPHLRWSFTPEHVSNLRALFERSYNYEAGCIYSIWAQGSFRIAKLLLADDRGVHLRLYANTFPDRPTTVDRSSLTLNGSGDGFARAVGHMPVVRTSFLAMGPKRIVTEPVSDDELDGYRFGLKKKGGTLVREHQAGDAEFARC